MLNRNRDAAGHWAWTYIASSLTTNNLNVPGHHITTSAQEQKEGQVRQLPQLPPRHFSPLLHQGAARPPIPSVSATHSSPPTAATRTAPLAPHPCRLPQPGQIRRLGGLILYLSPLINHEHLVGQHWTCHGQNSLKGMEYPSFARGCHIIVTKFQVISTTTTCQVILWSTREYGQLKLNQKGDRMRLASSQNQTRQLVQ